MSLLAAVVDVFVDEDDAHGAPVGLVWASMLTRTHEQDIAADLGVDEVVFIDGVADATATARVFTASAERPFSVQATVALAAWLLDGGDELRSITVPAGSVRVRIEEELVFVTALPEWLPEVELTEFATAEEVDAVDPDAYATGRNYVWAWIDESRGEVRARFFTAGDGVREGEASGSAAVRLSSELARDLRIVQGAGSVLTTHVRYLGQQVEVGGRVSVPREVEI